MSPRFLPGHHLRQQGYVPPEDGICHDPEEEEDYPYCDDPTCPLPTEDEWREAEGMPSRYEPVPQECHPIGTPYCPECDEVDSDA